MIQRLSVVLALVAAVGISVDTAEAQYRPFQISIAGGPSLPRGDLEDEAGTGFHVQGSVGFNLPLLPFGVRADAIWQELEDEQEGWFRQVGGIVNATVGIPLIIVEPYVLGGVSFLRTEAPEETHAGHTHDESENTVGFNAGAGVEFPFMGLNGFIEARVLNLLGSDAAKNAQTLPVTVGIRF